MDDNDDSLDLYNLNKAVENNVIHLLGRVEDVRPSIARCSVFVLPSYHEGTPRTVLEAMAMGRAIITTDAPGCRETVIEGLNGFKVPIKDVNLLAEKMIWMIKNLHEVEKMGTESRILCERKFDVHKVNDVIINQLGLL